MVYGLQLSCPGAALTTALPPDVIIMNPKREKQRDIKSPDVYTCTYSIPICTISTYKLIDAFNQSSLARTGPLSCLQQLSDGG